MNRHLIATLVGLVGSIIAVIVNLSPGGMISIKTPLEYMLTIILGFTFGVGYWESKASFDEGEYRLPICYLLTTSVMIITVNFSSLYEAKSTSNFITTEICQGLLFFFVFYTFRLSIFVKILLTIFGIGVELGLLCAVVFSPRWEEKIGWTMAVVVASIMINHQFRVVNLLTKKHPRP